MITRTRSAKMYKLEIKATKLDSFVSLTNSIEILSNHVVDDNIELWHK